ncbi:RAD9, HUS1, RAD1-interacting nuclear 1 [Channa argus]|uniref:RAD9, HUS1, RAD1-interacting nuclear 1 n=1 Tax=Channa argus TaxID=215402 RepID=A0A6G1QR78_CHAAH|nr:RAD9, HUS1, RAD1-interacting nuclear 1 [Channa argus]
MPRKATKTEKPPLPFVERPLCGAKLQNVPEVRAALNPKEFFTETHNSSALNSWVNPQFDSSLSAVPSVRRGRRRCQSATSVRDNCSQLSRKNSVCKFPSLLFHKGPRDQSQHPRRTCTKKTKVVSDTGNQPQRSCQIKRTVSSTHLDTPKIPTIQVTKRCRIPADSSSPPASTEHSSVDPPPDVDTPKAAQDRRKDISFPSVLFQLAQPCTPPCSGPAEILVANTPERDYGLKVTWRRRRGLMLLLKKKGHLSESDVLIQS